MICGRCNGTGMIEDFDVALGPDGLVPGYAEVPCPDCGGWGEFSEDEDTVDGPVCQKCRGRGMIIDIAMGMGPTGLVPSYRRVACPQCRGTGRS